MATLFGMFPFLKTLFADGGYQGPQFAKALAKVLPHLDVEIVKRSDRVSGFVVLPKRWIVERSIAWPARLLLAQGRVRQESWQRIGGASPPRGRSSQPPRPRVMHEVLLARAAVKRSQGRPRAKY